MGMKRVLAGLAGKMRRMASGFREKPTLAVDDYVMEHFLLYNGLIGSIPDDQPDYVDVRNEIVQAINDGSGHQLAIALKVAPLWWEDRLEKVFFAIAQINPEGALECLLAERPDDDITGDTAPLTHTDWRVRSNAARMLAVLEATEAVPRLIELLEENQENQKSAFCHIAHSLSRLGTDEARQALINKLDHDEHWFRVDVASSLANWQLEDVAADLMKAMVAGSEFDDYMAVAISRKHNPADFFAFEDEEINEGLAEMAIAMVKALNGPFHAEPDLPTQLEEISEGINRLAKENPTARRIAAAIELNRHLQKGVVDPDDGQLRDLSRKEHYEVIKACLTDPKLTSSAEINEVKHALSLASKFKLTELAPQVMPLLNADSPVLLEATDCVAALGHVEAAPVIAELVEKKINLAQRGQQSFSAHPVLESDKQSTDFYWTALKAMGSLPDKSSLDILSKAVNDYAPDKREQALLSLQTILLTEEMKKAYKGDLEALLRERIQDPSAQVQSAALTGVAQHNLVSLLPEALEAIHSKTQAVFAKAFDALLSLAKNGHKKAVRAAIESSLSKEFDANKKRRLSSIINRLERVS